MELQFEKTACRCLKQIAWEVQNQEQTQEVRLPDALPDIGRVLCAWGQVILRSKEWRGDGMSASGGVMAWVMYTPEDGSECRCMDTWIPFQIKWDFPQTQQEGRILLSPQLRSIDARTISARKMMVRVNVGILGEALEPWEGEICQPGEIPQGVELLRHTYPLRLPMEAGEKTFLLDEELTLPSSSPKADKIFRFEILPQILDQKVMAGKVVFRGNAIVHVLYRCSDGELAGWDFEIPFSQFGELEETLGQNAQVRLTVAVTSGELDLGEDGILRLKCGLVAQYVVSDEVLVELTEDAYSPHRDVNPNMTELVLPVVLDGRTEQLHGEQSVEIENGRVVDISFLPEFPRMDTAGDQINGEIPGTFQLLYQDAEGNLQSTTARWEGQWSATADPVGKIRLSVLPSGRPQAVSGGGGITVKGNVSLSAITTAETGLKMMTGMDVGEMREPDPGRPTLILCRAEDGQLWNLAKRCGSTVSAICQANQLQGEPMQGEMLLIPVL